MHALKQRMAKFAFDVNAPAGPRLVVLARDIATGSASSFLLRSWHCKFLSQARIDVLDGRNVSIECRLSG